MQTLFDLVHSMAKEEKRLYNLHGRKSRFTQIYKGYLAVNEYNKSLDRQIYSKHFSSFSRAFYSMQKNALLDDILAVLLEYSNSSKNDFIIYRLKAKYDVLNYKGFHDQAQNYIRSALDACEKISEPRLQLRILEDYRDTLARSSKTNWEEYEDVLRRIESISSMVAKSLPFAENLKKFNVLIKDTQNNPEHQDHHRDIAEDILLRISDFADATGDPEHRKVAFDSEYRFSRTFEDRFALHRRLVLLEKNSSKENYSRDIQLRVVSLLIESGLEVGDFLIINGMIYKTDKKLDQLTPEQRLHFLPRYLELCSIYYFYENDLQLAQNRLDQLMEIKGLSETQLKRYYFHKIGVLLAANLPRSAQEAMQEMLAKFSHLKQDHRVRLIELILAIEMNKKEDALVLLQRLRSNIRKSKESRKLSHYRQFLDMLQKFINKKRVNFSPIAALETDWMDLIKLNLWLKAKIDNNFYYNYILDYWQQRKQVVKV